MEIGTFGVQAIMVDTIGKNKKAIEEYIRKAVTRGYSNRSDKYKRIFRSI